jgi:hypothetical protein
MVGEWKPRAKLRIKGGKTRVHEANPQQVVATAAKERRILSEPIANIHSLVHSHGPWITRASSLAVISLF